MMSIAHNFSLWRAVFDFYPVFCCVCFCIRETYFFCYLHQSHLCVCVCPMLCVSVECM